MGMADLMQFAIKLANGGVDPGTWPVRRLCGAAAMTASKAVLKRMSNGFLRIALARLLEMWKELSGMIPRTSGSTQKSSGSSAESAIGNRPAE